MDRFGKNNRDVKQVIEFSLNLDSNPEFTGSVLTAYGRAVARLSKEGKSGVVTVFDVPIRIVTTVAIRDKKIEKIERAKVIIPKALSLRFLPLSTTDS